MKIYDFLISCAEQLPTGSKDPLARKKLENEFRELLDTPSADKAAALLECADCLYYCAKSVYNELMTREEAVAFIDEILELTGFSKTQIINAAVVKYSMRIREGNPKNNEEELQAINWVLLPSSADAIVHYDGKLEESIINRLIKTATAEDACTILVHGSEQSLTDEHVDYLVHLVRPDSAHRVIMCCMFALTPAQVTHLVTITTNPRLALVGRYLPLTKSDIDLLISKLSPSDCDVVLQKGDKKMFTFKQLQKLKSYAYEQAT